MNPKIFSSGISKSKDWRKAAESLIEGVKKDLGYKSCDVFVFFVSEAYESFRPDALARLIQSELNPRVLIGCNSSGVIGNQKEVEMEPAISVLAMHLPEVRLLPFYFSPNELEGIKDGAGLINFLDLYPTERPHFLCLADPASCDVTTLLNCFNEAYKGLPVIGGLASGGVMNKPNWLCLGDVIYKEGAVGVAFMGLIEFEVIVSQGCRPIAKSFVITKAQDNVLYEIAGRPALSALRDVIADLPPRDRELAQHSLFVGLAMNENQTQFRRGDFLIRNIMGFDPDTEALVIGSALRVGQTLQFQLRDAATSTEDLKALLEKAKKEDPAPRGGILVSCCGRGQNLFGEPDHDTTMIQAMKGPIALTGFFANGEIGPIGHKNYVHGYTSSLIILK